MAEFRVHSEVGNAKQVVATLLVTNSDGYEHMFLPFTLIFIFFKPVRLGKP